MQFIMMPLTQFDLFFLKLSYLLLLGVCLLLLSVRYIDLLEDR